MYILAQILGLVSLALTILSFFTKNKIIFIIYSLLFNFVLGIHYFLLCQVVAGSICMFASIRYITYTFKGKNKFFSGIWIPIFFIICNLIISICTFKNLFDILPTISAITLCITPWSNNIKVLKIGSLAVCPLWFVYDSLVSAWTALIMDIVTFIVTLCIFILQLLREKQNNSKTNNIKQIEVN